MQTLRLTFLPFRVPQSATQRLSAVSLIYDLSGCRHNLP